jgi:ArsR family transcriptional regulator
MDARIKKKFELQANVVKAIAHPTRLFIVDTLSQKEQCVCALAEMIGDDMSTVSRHLRVLKNAGIIKDEKRGTMVYYALSVPCVLGFFGCIEAVLRATTREQMKLVE